MRLAIFEIVGFVVLLTIVIGMFAGGRPNAARFFAANDVTPRPADLDHVEEWLGRSRRGRVAGGLVGMVLGALGGAPLGTGGMIGGAGIGLLAGAMLAIATGHPRPEPTTTDAQRAGLVARDERDYLPVHATAITYSLAGFLLAYGIFAMATAAGPLGRASAIFAVGFATIIAGRVGRRFQRRTLELRRADGDTQSIRVDDVLRASALRGIHHATIGVLMCGLLLLGFAAVSTQTYFGIAHDDRFLVQAEPLSTSFSARASSADPNHYDVGWQSPDGVRHRVRVTVPDRGYTVGTIWPNHGLVGLAYWLTVIGFLGALLQWGRAARAWRRPQRTPTPAPEVFRSTLGSIS
ncbi:MAG: hypothetical protein ABJC79_03245 [Acidimicrobiia bacterium]